MAKGKSILKRIDSSLSKLISDIRDKNDMTFREASKVAADLIRTRTSKERIITKEIKF